MAKNTVKISANVRDTDRPTIAGAKRHPALHALRTVVARVTTPLLPDDYLQLANPLWSARELRGRVQEVRQETVDSATLVIKPGWGSPSTTNRASTSASGFSSRVAGGGGPIR